jgi:Tol biopolymer transport system component
MQDKRRLRRLRGWRGLGMLALVGMLALAGCGADAGNNGPGVDLGSGTLLAFIGGDGNLYLAREDGSQAHAVTTTACPSTVNCYQPPAWSPDGKLVAVFGPDKTTPTNNDIYIYDRQGVLQNTIQPANPLSSGQLLWSSDSATIAYAGNPTSGALTGGSSTTQTSAQYGFIIFNVASGKLSSTIPLPVPNPQCSDNPTGGPLGSFIDHAINGDANGFRTTLDWSPDRSHILISSSNCGNGVDSIDAHGNVTQLNPITANANVLEAIYSPDGQHILATETNSTQDDIVIFNADGSSGKVIYTDTDTPPAFVPRLSSPTWSADGKTIYFMRGADIWQVNADGSNAQKLIAGDPTASDPVQKDEAAPLPSPDGTKLAWEELSLAASDGVPRSALYVGDSHGGNPQLVQNGAIWSAWS